MFCADCVSDFKGLHSRQFSSVPFDQAWNMRPKFGVEDQLKACKDYKVHFAETLDSPASTTDSIRLSLSGSALQDEIKSCTAILMHTSSPASFSNYGIFIPKVRVPSSSNKKIINIVELCPTVDSPLERTSEGNPRVQYVDQVQNPTNNQFTYQILFSFSSDKDRRTDSRIRRKTQRSPAGNRTQGLVNSSRTL